MSTYWFLSQVLILFHKQSWNDNPMRNYFWTICFIIFFNGCATLKPQRSPAALAPAFTVSGAIAAKNQQRGWTANFYWEQKNPQDYQILISGPLGSETMEITQHQSEVTYREGKKVIHAKQAETLLAKETGIRLPVDHLYYWIKGKPAPGPIQAIKRSPDQDILVLQQSGYTLEYSNYRDHYPYKIRLIGHQLMVKIVVKDWNMN